MTEAQVEEAIRHFEGLVIQTASQVVAGGAEIEFEDVAQILRMKVWESVRAFNPSRAVTYSSRGGRGRSRLERYVYGNVLNARKDIEKRPRRFNQSLDAHRDEEDSIRHADRFDAQYLSTSAEEVYSESEREELRLPSTLTDIERRAVMLRMDGRKLQEIEAELGLTRGQRLRMMASVQDKLADWRPTGTMPSLPEATAIAA